MVSAIAQARSFTGAARLLGVAHTTISRKLTQLEAHFGTRLADRRDDGVFLTAEGERLLETARQIHSELRALERDIAGTDHRLTGHVTVTTIDALAWYYMPQLARFRSAHPDIELAVEVGTELRNLSRREAEIALRLTNTPDEHLFGRRIGRFDFYPYVRAELRGGPIPWLEYNGRDCAQPAARWMRKEHPDARIQASVPSPLMMLRAIEAGLGAGLVPSQLAGALDGLEQLADDPAFSVDIWLLTPMELRRTARIRALFDAFQPAP